MAVGLVLVGLNIYGSVTTARRDYGRRRALGASRTDIITLVTTQTVTIAITGTLAGSLVGGAIIWRLTGTPPDAGFAVAVAVLAVLAAAIAAIPPAMVAAWRDPVSILRVP
ncbi:FtsX-like permease family protein [bacterium BMS3Abin02]|nr:FtsX-like permease family protein [bacterium BMS3Abin02]